MAAPCYGDVAELLIKGGFLQGSVHYGSQNTACVLRYDTILAHVGVYSPPTSKEVDCTFTTSRHSPKLPLDDVM